MSRINFVNSIEERPSRITPTIEKEIKLLNENIAKSIKASELKFTNFYLQESIEEIGLIKEILNDLDKIREYDLEMADEIRVNNDRIKGILGLYLDDVDSFIEKDIRKVNVKTEEGATTRLRIYFCLNDDMNSYDIVAIDIFHLIIPSRFQGKSKEEMLNLNFTENEANNKCISVFCNNY